MVLLSLKSTCEENEVAMDQILGHLPRNPGPSAENANKSLAICQDCQGPSAENANKSSAICQDCQGPSAENANKSSAICRDCQELLLKCACQGYRVCLGCRLIRQPRQPINSETEFAKASQGPADEFIVRETSQISEIPLFPLTNYRQHNATPFRLKISTIIGNSVGNSIELHVYHLLPVVLKLVLVVPLGI